jgi:uncharacterized protein (DUF1800 family)
LNACFKIAPTGNTIPDRPFCRRFGSSVEREVPMPKVHPMLQPYVPGEADPFDSVRAAHLLNRAGFGGTPDDIAEVLRAGPAAAVDRLLDFPDAHIDEQTPDDQPDLSQIEEYPRSFSDRQKLFEDKTPEERMLLQQRLNAANRQAIVAIGDWWLNRMATGPHPLQERLTFFWHGHFTTSARDERSAWLMWKQNETLRRHAAGNFGTFVKSISRDPAMLDYLNNQQNRKGRPNENYARELMELFTLGIGNYTEQDVKEAARAFTGWGHDGEDFLFRKSQHDDNDKTLFGVKGNLNGDDVVDLILRHDACGPYIAARLIRHFVHDTFDPSLAAALGDVLRENGYELRPAIRTLLTSKAFYASSAIGTQVKSPVQLIVGTARLLGVRLPDARRLAAALEQMGQVPLMPPNVKGWPGGRHWINTSTLFVRYNTALFIAGSADPVGGGQPRRRQADRGRDNAAFDPKPGTDAGGVVDHWVGRLIQRPISAAKRNNLIESLQNRPDDPAKVKGMVDLILSMPEYQLC